MATKVTASIPANVPSLEEHGDRLLQLYLEPLLAEATQSRRGRSARKAVESGLYRHLWEALESWWRGDVA